MADTKQYAQSQRKFSVRIGSFQEGYGTKDASTGKWSNTRTWHVIIPYTEDVTVHLLKGETDSPISAASVTMDNYVVPANTLTGSIQGASFGFERSSTTRQLGRVSENGFYRLTEVTRTAGTPVLQSAGVGTPPVYTPDSDEILLSDRTYTQAIGSCNVGYGIYDPKNNTWSQHRNAVVIAKFRERTWEKRALTSCSANTSHLLMDTYPLSWGLIGSLNWAFFDFEYTRIESQCNRASPNGFYSRATTFKETIGVEVA